MIACLSILKPFPSRRGRSKSTTYVVNSSFLKLHLTILLRPNLSGPTASRPTPQVTVGRGWCVSFLADNNSSLNRLLQVFSVNAVESGPNNFATFQSQAKALNGTGNSTTTTANNGASAHLSTHNIRGAGIAMVIAGVILGAL